MNPHDQALAGFYGAALVRCGRWSQLQLSLVEEQAATKDGYPRFLLSVVGCVEGKSQGESVDIEFEALGHFSPTTISFYLSDEKGTPRANHVTATFRNGTWNLTTLPDGLTTSLDYQPTMLLHGRLIGINIDHARDVEFDTSRFAQVA
jgi:hypothetical protein